MSFLTTLIGEGCKEVDTDGRTNTYIYTNESGVEVALVGKTYKNFNIPDSLVLQDGESKEYSFSFNSFSGGMFSTFPYERYDYQTTPLTYIPLKIYFDKTIPVVYYFHGDNPDLRNPLFAETKTSYHKTQREEKKKKYIRTITTYTYIFTAEDYQNAIKGQP